MWCCRHRTHSRAKRPYSCETWLTSRWCITQEHGSREALQLTMRTAGFTPNVVLTSFNSRALVLSAEIGLGVGVIPVSADTRGANVALVPLAEPALTRHVFALVRSGSQESPPIRAVLDAMEDAVATPDGASLPWLTVR